MGETGKVSRRTMLRWMAAAGGASVLRPAPALADTGQARVVSRWLGALAPGSERTVDTARFALVGLQWLGPREVEIELRARLPDGRWGPWVSASSAGHDGDGQHPRPAQFGEPLWIGNSGAIQLRADRALEALRVHLVAARASAGASAAASYPLARPVLAAGPGQPPILARRGWARGQAPPTHPAEYGTIKLAFVHHTVNPNGYSADEVPSMLLAIFDYHVQVRGFWDIAYNFLIDAYGRIWEGRAGGIDAPVIGAQAGGYNAQSTGVAMLGDFMDVVPTRAAMTTLRHFLAWKLSLHGVPAYGRTTVVVEPSGASYTPYKAGAHVSLPRIAGHRDGDLTDCPGNALYHRLPALRPRVRTLAGNPAMVTITTPTTRQIRGQAFAVSGQLVQLDGTPLAGAPIEVQQLNRRQGVTIATAQTAQDGTWSATVTLTRSALLRALHAPAPACVSDYEQVTIKRGA